MAKNLSLCILIFLLFLTFSDNLLARPEPTFSDVIPVEIHGKGYGVEKANGEGEDEWLMRSTLEAHVDYIYTQKQKQP
ncbi:hypothetical protein SASPL_122327 [Salvia splendens]|uniref:Phytosulfokine n=1 Tax=Salvia splendens TaxID=180675 RepID=A0A8X8XN56_SALSN|nr:hypothetical protein SASPL_122327 [Salvia splendens]